MVRLAQSPKTAVEVEESRRRRRVLEVGLFGFIGSRGEKVLNIAFIVLLISFALLACVLIWYPDGGSLSKKDAALVAGGFISLILGYILGQTPKA